MELNLIAWCASGPGRKRWPSWQANSQTVTTYQLACQLGHRCHRFRPGRASELCYWTTAVPIIHKWFIKCFKLWYQSLRRWHLLVIICNESLAILQIQCYGEAQFVDDWFKIKSIKASNFLLSHCTDKSLTINLNIQMGSDRESSLSIISVYF